MIRLARLVCAAENVDSCDTANAPPQLRVGPHGPVLANTGGGPVADTIAWSGMRGFELTESMWLCVDSVLPQSKDAIPLKLSPVADMSRVAQVVYALPRPPRGSEAKRCVDTSGLARPQGGSKRLFLTDALRDNRGRFQIAYLAAEYSGRVEPRNRHDRRR